LFSQRKGVEEKKIKILLKPLIFEKSLIFLFLLKSKILKQIQLSHRIRMQQAERDKICRYCLDNASLFDLVNEGIIIPESVRSKWEFEKLIRGCLGEGQFKVSFGV
jgi:hypothetical protein